MKSTVWAVVLLCSIGCSDPAAHVPSKPQPPVQVPVDTLPARGSEVVQTDTPKYVAQAPQGGGQWRFRVIARFTNTRPDTLFLGRCFPDSPRPTYGVELLQPLNGEGSAFDPVWACVGV